MKLHGQTITTAQTVAIFHALATATDKARWIMRQSQDGDIAPNDAASRLNALLSTMQLSLAECIDPAPPVPVSLGFRYFKDDYLFWKMPLSGTGLVREEGEPWDESVCALIDFIGRSQYQEVTAEEAEP